MQIAGLLFDRESSWKVLTRPLRISPGLYIGVMTRLEDVLCLLLDRKFVVNGTTSFRSVEVFVFPRGFSWEFGQLGLNQHLDGSPPSAALLALICHGWTASHVYEEE